MDCSHVVRTPDIKSSNKQRSMSELIYDYYVREVFLGVIFWSIFYYILRKSIFVRYCPEFTSRVVAAIHALIVTPLAFICLCQGPNPFEECGTGEPTTDLQEFVLLVSLSYFIYDFCWCILFGSEPAIMIVHHLSSITSLYIILVKGESGAEAVVGLGTMEASNPYLQLRWFLRCFGYNNTPLHTFFELYFFTLFFIMRLGLGTKLTYSIVNSCRVKTGVKTCTLLLYIVSLAFVFYIFQYIKRKYFKRSGKNLNVDKELKKEL